MGHGVETLSYNQHTVLKVFEHWISRLRVRRQQMCVREMVDIDETMAEG